MTGTRSRRSRIVAGAILAGVWATAWLIVGLGLGAFNFWREGPVDFDVLWPPGHFYAQMAEFAGLFAVIGAVMGALFAIALSFGERRRTAEQLSFWRVSLWGGLAGALVAAAFELPARIEYRYEGWLMDELFVLGIFAILGASSAAVTLVVSRFGSRSPDDGTA